MLGLLGSAVTELYRTGAEELMAPQENGSKATKALPPSRTRGSFRPLSGSLTALLIKSSSSRSCFSDQVHVSVILTFQCSLQRSAAPCQSWKTTLASVFPVLDERTSPQFKKKKKKETRQQQSGAAVQIWTAGGFQL